jgi:hypothetical protein
VLDRDVYAWLGQGAPIIPFRRSRKGKRRAAARPNSGFDSANPVAA